MLYYLKVDYNRLKMNTLNLKIDTKRIELYLISHQSRYTGIVKNYPKEEKKGTKNR